MSIARNSVLVVCGVLALSVVGAAAWIYSDSYYCASSADHAGSWLDEEHHYARFQFHRIPLDMNTLVFDVLVFVPGSPEVRPAATQTVRVRLRPTGGPTTSHQVVLELMRNGGSYFAYTGQLVVSRRALQVGTCLEVRLERAHWQQMLGITEHSVRLRCPAADVGTAGRMAQFPGPTTIHETTLGGTALGVGGPMSPLEEDRPVERTGALPVEREAVEATRRYIVPLALGEHIALRVTFTGGSGALTLVAPDGTPAAAVRGEGELELSYRVDQDGDWQLHLARETDGNIRYALRIETAG